MHRTDLAPLKRNESGSRRRKDFRPTDAFALCLRSVLLGLAPCANVAGEQFVFVTHVPFTSVRGCGFRGPGHTSLRSPGLHQLTFPIWASAMCHHVFVTMAKCLHGDLDNHLDANPEGVLRKSTNETNEVNGCPYIWLHPCMS